MEAIETKEIKGISFKTVATIIGATAVITSSYFFTMGNINAKIDSVDDKVESIDGRVKDMLFRDSLRLQVMQMQIDQIRQDIMANRVILRDIRDTQIAK